MQEVVNPWSIGKVSDDIQFVVRTRTQTRAEIWSVGFDPSNGNILEIVHGKSKEKAAIQVSFASIKAILAGTKNQNDYCVVFNESVGALDLVDIKAPVKTKQRVKNVGWLSNGEYQGALNSDIRTILFNDSGILRVETTRQWSTNVKERMETNAIEETIPFFITDIEDPHQLFGKGDIRLVDIVERGFWETRLWAFMNHDVVQKILYHGQKVRINLPPVAESLFFTRLREYSQFSGVVDDQTVMSHIGPGKHISIFVKDGALWAQSHYQPGSPIDNLIGNLELAVLKSDDAESFVQWTQLPALLLRQNAPFEISDKWLYPGQPSLLYKANNLDIGVLN